MHLYPKRALLEGSEAEIFKLLSFGATPEQWAEWLRAPLEHAATRGNLDLVTKLLKAGANGGAGWRGCRGRTMLDAAALGGNPDVVAALLKAGCRPDAKVVSVSSKRSALHLAVVCGHTEAARKLILAGANVKYTDPADQCSPLHAAAAGGHEDTVTDLLISGASPHNGHLSAARLLLAAGADVHQCDECAVSALHYAAGEGYVGVVEAILEHGGDVTKRDFCRWTALHWAANSDQATVDALLDAGADVNVEAMGSITPLHLAAKNNSTEALVALLRRGADVDKAASRGLTALHCACQKKVAGVATMVDILLRWGASEIAVDVDGRTPALMLERRSALTSQCSADEAERARVLLARAPADRAWRRRGWLVMLRSRAEKERLARLGGNDSSQMKRSCSDNKVRRIDAAARGGGAGVGSAGVGAGGASAGGGLSSWVAALVELESGGLFRAIVGFL
eukprot:g6636.t1